MENRPFNQALTQSLLESYEIQEDNTPTPSLAPDSYVSKDLLKSATIENLISQNEELMNRQKVTLRRLATLEDLNQELQAENFQQKNQILNYSDQVQVLKEKDAAWKAKVDELEVEKENLSRIAQEFEKTQSELERHRKYHDKVKYQVKPYIQSLKTARDQAQKEQEALWSQLQLKDTQVRDVRLQMQEVLRQAKNQVDDIQRQKQGLVEHFETQIQNLKEEKLFFETSYNELKNKLTQMHIALEKKAELENRVIELDRSKQDIKTQLENEIIRLQGRVNDLDALRTRFEIENTDLKAHIQDDYQSKIKTEEEIIQLRRQMESLRFMWNQKNEESERQRKSLEALEKLNYSLSQKLEEVRKAHQTLQQNRDLNLRISQDLKSDLP